MSIRPTSVTFFFSVYSRSEYVQSNQSNTRDRKNFVTRANFFSILFSFSSRVCSSLLNKEYTFTLCLFEPKSWVSLQAIFRNRFSKFSNRCEPAELRYSRTKIQILLQKLSETFLQILASEKIFLAVCLILFMTWADFCFGEGRNYLLRDDGS